MIDNKVKDDVLAVLLEAAPDVARIADNQGLLPLHYVAAFCHTPGATAKQLSCYLPMAMLLLSKVVTKSKITITTNNSIGNLRQVRFQK